MRLGLPSLNDDWLDELEDIYFKVRDNTYRLVFDRLAVGATQFFSPISSLYRTFLKAQESKCYKTC